MGIYQGSLAFTRYRVLGTPGKTTIASLSKLLSPFVSPAIRVDGPAKPEAIGWVRPLTASDEKIVSDESHWDMSDCHVDGNYLMRVRYERRKVPSSLVQMLYRAKLREHLQKTGKTMARAERQEYKQELLQDLLRRTLPVIQFTDVLWKEDQHELFVFSTSKSVRQRIEQLFHQTFGNKLDLSLVRLDGPLAFLDDEDASEKSLSQRLGRVAKMEPAIFSPQKTN